MTRVPGDGGAAPAAPGPAAGLPPRLASVPGVGEELVPPRPDHPSGSALAAPGSRFDQPGLRSFVDLSLGEIAERAGLRRIDVVAWRDFDDPEAGGSELHAHRVLSLWSAAGLDVSVTTSAVPGGRTVVRRDGYRVVRRAGRYGVFPRTMVSGALGRIGSGDGLLEIWNGMPFFSPLWAHCPRIVFLHHVHDEMWKLVLPSGLAEAGHAVEHRLAPPLYRHSRIVTLSSSSRREIIDRLRIQPDRVTVCPPGVEPRFVPGGERSPVPLVVAVGRLVPVKRFHLLIDALVRLRADHPTLEAVIVGEGYERPALEERIARAGAQAWLSLPGHVSDEGLISLYQRAWSVASTSLREGWGMTVTEAGACGTPTVASKIAGHEDAVADGRSGLLVDPGRELVDGMVDNLDAVLRDEVLRRRLGLGAQEHATRLTWDATARGTLAALGAEALARP